MRQGCAVAVLFCFDFWRDEPRLLARGASLGRVALSGRMRLGATWVGVPCVCAAAASVSIEFYEIDTEASRTKQQSLVVMPVKKNDTKKLILPKTDDTIKS